jgi:H+-transporting ATPase
VISSSPAKAILPSPGLTNDDARRRLDKFGLNTIPDASVLPWQRALSKFWAPVPWMLETAVVLELVLGKYVEASIIVVLLVFNAALGYFQEGRAQATIEALRSRLALNATVRRENAWATVPASGIVPGDIVKLSVGAVVPADVRLTEGDVLLDQSMLTGESIPIEGTAGMQTYAGALVRRGEAIGAVTATGALTKFGRAAKLVRTAHVESSQQKAVLRVVRNLAMFSGGTLIFLLAYAAALRLPVPEMVSLALTAVLAAIPIGLPATFTLAAALGARDLAHLGVLPTRLSAVDEAASIDVLCADKTGTLTLNALSVTSISPMPGFDEAHVLGWAALASSDGGQDPVDAAICAAASKAVASDLPKLVKFVPFDSATKMSEATAVDSNGATMRAVKGAFASVIGLAPQPPGASETATQMEAKGYRVLAVAVGPTGALRLAGIISLSDPPREDSGKLVAELRTLGVRTIMVTGDAPATAAIVAHAVGIAGSVCGPGPTPAGARPEDFGVYAGVMPEGKYNLVKAFQKSGHVVGMCGDGANDAPALRQAQMGIAVSTATDVAKSAAGIVLTKPGLGGIVASIKEGRVTFQRILTYTLNSVTGKISKLLFLAVGLFMTGQAILTPMLMVILMLCGDLLGMSLTTDNVHPSPHPNSWQIGGVTFAGLFIGLSELIFCSVVLGIAKFHFGLGLGALRSVTFVVLTFGNQATTYTNRGRQRLGSSRPSWWVIGSSATDVLIASILVTGGIAMTPLPLSAVGLIFVAAAVFASILNVARVAVFKRLKIA